MSRIMMRAPAWPWLLLIPLATFPLPASTQETPMGFKVPPSPALSPRDEIKSFKIAPGYHVELVAAEPLVHDPVAITFDPDGRLWVCEMRGYMPDVDGNGEKEPVGTISVLEDTRGTGIMDKRTVFEGGLVLPRAVCWTTDGVLVAANGKIWLCRVGADLTVGMTERVVGDVDDQPAGRRSGAVERHPHQPASDAPATVAADHVAGQHSLRSTLAVKFDGDRIGRLGVGRQGAAPLDVDVLEALQATK